MIINKKDMDSSIGERLNAYMAVNKISQNALAEILSTSQSAISSMCNGKRNISKNTIYKLSNAFPDLNSEWLLTGEGEMLKKKDGIEEKKSQEGNARDLGSVYAATPGDRDSIVMVDYIPVSAQASFTEYLGQSDARYEEKLPLIATPAERAELDRYKIFEVAGDSMFPTLVSGSKILVKSIPEASWHNAEGVVVAVFLDYVVIKRVKSNHFFTDHYIILSSDNPEYGEMTVQFSDIRALYKARRVVSAPIS